MSASWDPDREGSAFGADEFSTNLGNIKDGLQRTKENALLREKMMGLSEAEIERAIADSDKRKDAAMKRQKEWSE